MSDRLYATNICFCKSVDQRPDEPTSYMDIASVGLTLKDVPPEQTAYTIFDRQLAMDLCGPPRDYHIEIEIKAPAGQAQRLWSGTMHWNDISKPTGLLVIDLRGQRIFFHGPGIYEFHITTDGAPVAMVAMPFVAL